MHLESRDFSHDGLTFFRTDGGLQKMTPLTRLQVALKSTTGIAYFDCDVPAHALFGENSKLGTCAPVVSSF